MTRRENGDERRAGDQSAGLEPFGALMTISRSSRMSARRSWISALHVCPEVPDGGLHVVDAGVHVGVLLKNISPIMPSWN